MRRNKAVCDNSCLYWFLFDAVTVYMNSILALERLLLQISIDLQPSIEVIGTHPHPFNVPLLSQKLNRNVKNTELSLLTLQIGGKQQFL